MALIKCSECGAEISEKAEACPKCGHPLRKELKKKRYWIIAAILFIIALYFFFDVLKGLKM